MNSDPILEQLAPPAGGWQRLIARRETPMRARLGVPAALAATLAIVALLVWPRSPEIDVPWGGGRLVAQPSAGAGLQHVAEGRATAIPTDEPGVRLYWVQDQEE